MKKIKLGELCKPSAGQIKEDSDKLIDYIDISKLQYHPHTHTCQPNTS